MNTDFNKLEFNLYELLNLEQNCNTTDVKKKFRKIVKKFHPDKISKLEEKIYYNITLAHQILSNEKKKLEYDTWLNNKNFQSLKTNFNNSDVESYFPKNKMEANKSFIENSKKLLERHGKIDEDNRTFDIRINNLNQKRNNLKVPDRMNFRDTDDFNNNFIDIKKNGISGENIICYDNEEIVPYQKMKKNIGYMNLKDFDKLYVEDTVEAINFTSLDRAFKLQPYLKEKNNNISKSISEYENQTENFKTLDINF